MSDGEPDILQEARDWAERIDAKVVGSPLMGDVEIRLSEGHYIEIYGSGVVRLRQERMLAGGNGTEVSFGDRRLTVTDGNGNEHRVSPSEFPSGWEMK
jgi:hypothetical protein